MTRARMWLYAALTVGTIDILDAFIFYGRMGATPVRILQSIASGVLGPAASGGGIPAAGLGLVCHYLISFGVVVAYDFITRPFAVVRRHPIFFGIPYGLVVYAVMQYVVVPLSRAAGGHPHGAALANALWIHALGVGFPAAMWVWFFDRRSRAVYLRR